MTKRFYSAKPDGNQSEIVAALRAAGYIVDLTHRLGGGFPDLIVYTKTDPGVAVPMEIKMPGEVLNEREVKWWGEHANCLATTVHGVDEALSYMALCDMWVKVG